MAVGIFLDSQLSNSRAFRRTGAGGICGGGHSKISDVSGGIELSFLRFVEKAD